MKNTGDTSYRLTEYGGTEKMSFCGTKLVEQYGQGNAKERFRLIFKNYEVFMNTVDSYERGIIHLIIKEKEYNRQNQRGDLGVRVQTSGISDPTARKAIELVTVQEAIRKADFSSGLLKDTDAAEEHRREILIINMMREEFDVFEYYLKSLPDKDFKLVYTYIHDRVTSLQIAEDTNMAHQTIRNKLCIIQKSLEEAVLPFFSENL